MWNYLYYIAYLKDKTQTEYTGIESYVADKLDKKEITWFPTNRYAKSLFFGFTLTSILFFMKGHVYEQECLRQTEPGDIQFSLGHCQIRNIIKFL